MRFRACFPSVSFYIRLGGLDFQRLCRYKLFLRPAYDVDLNFTKKTVFINGKELPSTVDGARSPSTKNRRIDEQGGILSLINIRLFSNVDIEAFNVFFWLIVALTNKTCQ